MQPQDPSTNSTSHADVLDISVMLVGFDGTNRAKLEQVFTEKLWQYETVSSGKTALLLSMTRRYDLIAIDVDNVEIYAPELLAKIRDGGSSANTRLVATGEILLPELKTQLTRAGADMVFEANHASEFLITRIDDALKDGQD